MQALEEAGPRRERIALESPPVSALPAVPAASQARTLVEVLEWHAAQHPGRLHLTVLQDEATVLGTLTYAELAARARNVARGLIARDVAPGDRVALMLPTSIDFFIAFFGILCAGAIPVPIYPPMRLSQLEDHLRRQTTILRNAGSCMLITMPEGRRLARLLRPQVESLMRSSALRTWRRLRHRVELPLIKGPTFDRAHPVHIREHGRSERRGAQSRQPACQCSSDGRQSWMRAQPTSSSVGCRFITTWA